MSTQHKIMITLPVGDPDLGAEVDLEVTYTFSEGAPAQGPSYASGGQPADPHEVEFVSARQFIGNKPVEKYGSFADLEQSSLDSLAESWLEEEEGFNKAVQQALEDKYERR